MCKKNILIWLVIFVLTPLAVSADGMIVPPAGYYIWETEQRAVIFYEDGTEELVLSISFQGNAKDFAWIVPTPTRPEVRKASNELFDALDELTTPIYDYYEPMPLMYGVEQRGIEDKVWVVETKQIEYYEIVVLEARESEALTDWLNKNGYNYPQEGKYVLESYIKNGWYFTAVKINDEYLSSNVAEQLRSGRAVPLSLKFTTDKIVYPLKISSVRPNIELVPRGYYPGQQVGILLYVISDNKQELPKFITQYAGWIDKETIGNLAYSDTGEPWLFPVQERYFLTKLFRYMSHAEMTNDLYLRQASDKSLVNAPPETGERGWTGFVLVMGMGGLAMMVLLAMLLWAGTRKEK